MLTRGRKRVLLASCVSVMLLSIAVGFAVASCGRREHSPLARTGAGAEHTSSVGPTASGSLPAGGPVPSQQEKAAKPAPPSLAPQPVAGESSTTRPSLAKDQRSKEVKTVAAPNNGLPPSGGDEPATSGQGNPGQSSPAQAAKDWPSFRGNARLTGFAEGRVSLQNLRWTYETGSSIEGAAAIVDDTVYVGTKEGVLLALNLIDGTLKWRFSAAAAISAAPCVAGGRAYVGDEGGTFYAVNQSNGALIWKFQTGSQIMSSATCDDGAVLVGSYDHKLYKLDSSTGREKWSFTTDAQVHCSPCVVSGLVIIAGCDGKVRMIDLETGRQRASASADTSFGASPAYGSGCVFLGNMAGEYLCVRVADGEIVWSKKEPDGATIASAAVLGDAVIFASSSGEVFRMDRASGATRWTFRTGAESNSSPVIVGDSIFVGSDDGNLYKLRLSDGKELQRFSAGAALKASVAVGQGSLVVGSTDGAVYCFRR